MSKCSIQYLDRVKINSTTDNQIDGATGTILGVSSDHGVVKFLIVGLDVPLATCSAIVLIDSCLELLSD